MCKGGEQRDVGSGCLDVSAVVVAYGNNCQRGLRLGKECNRPMCTRLSSTSMHTPLLSDGPSLPPRPRAIGFDRSPSCCRCVHDSSRFPVSRLVAVPATFASFVGIAVIAVTVLVLIVGLAMIAILSVSSFLGMQRRKSWPNFTPLISPSWPSLYHHCQCAVVLGRSRPWSWSAPISSYTRVHRPRDRRKDCRRHHSSLRTVLSHYRERRCWEKRRERERTAAWPQPRRSCLNVVQVEHHVTVEGLGQTRLHASATRSRASTSSSSPCKHMGLTKTWQNMAEHCQYASALSRC